MIKNYIHLMTIEHQFVDQMAADKASPPSHENALPVLISPELDLWVTTCLGKQKLLVPQISYDLSPVASLTQAWRVCFQEV